MTKTVRVSIWAAISFIGGLLVTLPLLLRWAEPAIGQQADGSALSSRPEAVVLTLSGAVTPTSADYLSREIESASATEKELIILEIDTPGGLVTSMEAIIQSILASKTPVVTYVSPQGAKSASAGLYIMYAAHISAMAPATNTGSATPVQLGGGGAEPELEPVETNPPPDDNVEPGDEAAGDGFDADNVRDVIETARPNAKPQTAPLSNDNAMRAKIINNSVAYIRSLAELRGRNADWAESAVRDAANVTASKALELNVIDLIAEDTDDLLRQINGRKVKGARGTKTINTDGIILTRIEPTFAEKILGFFADPNVAAILMSIGMLGITVELWNPGSIFPGIVGFVCLGLGLYAAQTLPFEWLGVWLIVGGIFLIVLEAYTPTLGIVGLVGLIIFGAGLYLLFPETLRVSNGVIITSVGLAGGFLALIMFALVGSRSQGPMIGGDAIKNRDGVVDEWDGLTGHVIVEGERWSARCNNPLKPGDKVKVVQVDGLVLVVRRAKAEGGLLAKARPEITALQ